MAAEQLLNGRYRLLRPLGTGGMASVYLAEDLRLGRRVAVKILHPQFAADPVFVARFEGEARMVAALSHPNIVQVYDVGHDGNRYYIVMEYVDGETLKDAIARQGPLPVTRSLKIISSVLSALGFAHAHQLVHRDIKSQNVLLTPNGDVKVTDFGIAREVGGSSTPTLTATNMVIGTVQYFSPEQAQGRPATPQSDVYAAGIVLFEMLTGKLPFEADNPLAVAMQQINQAPPLPTRLNRAIPAPVEAIILKALAKNPAERYAGASAMKAAVDGALAGAAAGTRAMPRVAAPPPPQATRATRTAPTVNVNAGPRTATAAPPRPSSRGLWIAIVALILILLALLGVFAHEGGFNGIGGFASTATPTATPSPFPTLTPFPTATVPIVVPPIRRPTVTATPTVETPTPTRATDTPTPPPTATAPPATHTPRPRPTDTPRPTSTPHPTDTVAPATDTPLPTATPAPTATPTAPATDTPGPTDTPTSQASNGAGTVVLTPSTVIAGDTFVVSGDGWPPGQTVTISADFGFGAGPQPLRQATVGPDGAFSARVSLSGDTSAGSYPITVADDNGDTASSNLSVNQ